MLHKLGWGHFSTVWLVLDNKTGEYGAMKVRTSTLHPCCSAITSPAALVEACAGITHGDVLVSAHRSDKGIRSMHQYAAFL